MGKQSGPSSCYQGEFSFRLHLLGIFIDLWNYIQHIIFPGTVISIELHYQDCFFISLSCCFIFSLWDPIIPEPGRDTSTAVGWSSQQQWPKAEGVGNGWGYQLEVWKGFFPLQNSLAINVLNLRIGRYPKLYPNQLYVKSKYIPWWETWSLEPSILIPAPYFFLSHTLGSPTAMGQDIMGLRTKWVCGGGKQAAWWSCIITMKPGEATNVTCYSTLTQYSPIPFRPASFPSQLYLLCFLLA